MGEDLFSAKPVGVVDSLGEVDGCTRYLVF